MFQKSVDTDEEAGLCIFDLSVVSSAADAPSVGTTGAGDSTGRNEFGKLLASDIKVSSTCLQISGDA